MSNSDIGIYAFIIFGALVAVVGLWPVLLIAIGVGLAWFID